MQMLLHIPDALAERFKQTVPVRKRSEFVAKLLEQALPEEDDDPLYLIALAVEQDEALNAEMKEWREGLIGDGIREYVDMDGGVDATR